MSLKKLAIASLVLAAPLTSQAAIISIDGVDFNPGAQFITTTLWETVLLKTTDVFSGVGLVTDITNTGGAGETWINGQNNTQLTYFFTGYTVTAWYDILGVKHLQGDEVGFNLAQAIDFSGGSVKVYADSTITGTKLNPGAAGSTIPGDIAAATDGKLWLDMVGSQFSRLSSAGVRSGTLLGDVNGTTSIHVGSSGEGYLDVVGGDAGANFDTNSWLPTGATGPSDARFDSKSSTTNSGAWPLSGVASIKTQAIPEPGSLALAALGLLCALGVRRKSA